MQIDTNSFRYKLGRNIARIRETQGITQAEMEYLTGISRAYYGRVELGMHSISIDKLELIANCFGIPVGELFLDKNKKQL